MLFNVHMTYLNRCKGVDTRTTTYYWYMCSEIYIIIILQIITFKKSSFLWKYVKFNIMQQIALTMFGVLRRIGNISQPNNDGHTVDLSV